MLSKSRPNVCKIDAEARRQMSVSNCGPNVVTYIIVLMIRSYSVVIEISDDRRTEMKTKRTTHKQTVLADVTWFKAGGREVKQPSVA
jgi:hypothetical protein